MRITSPAAVSSRTRLAAAVVGGIVVLGTVAGAGVATAANVHTAASTKVSGKITACVSKATGSTRVVTKTSKCRTGEKAVRWMKGMRYRGAWSALTTYRVGDVVFSGGASYVARKKTKGAVPGVATTTWVQLSTAGRAGATGATGSTGATVRNPGTKQWTQATRPPTQQGTYMDKPSAY